MTVKELARAATIDAPAATVAINDLEAARARRARNRSDESAVQDGVADRVTVVPWSARIDAIDDPAPEVLGGAR